ncbi:LacI family DNA-binding transcriptional regulator [Micromonospora sp. KC606]|uniref:LacI family DNA-binding transcriptional regulator n=1 Tax=Micromonospora sp. KC606 TaxID=2530379 RepID=UPI00244330D8|nr:LacI family DNA-binding transcriptional regulator [Micromonospora sp. KC606]
MADVARRAGVSVSTVSYALNGTRPISAETRARIEAAMAELRYTPNIHARRLRGLQSKIIALLYPGRGRGIDISSLGYILGASDHAQSMDYHLLLWTTEAGSLASLRTLVGQGLLDGVLLMEVKMDDPRITVLTEAGIPFAMIGQTGRTIDVDWVDTDFDQCVHVALEHLATLGHRHVVFVNQAAPILETRLSFAIRAQQAAQTAAARMGLDLATVACDSTAAAGSSLINRLLDQDPQLTGVLTLNEQAAPGIMAGALTRGLRVPDHLSIVAIAMSEQAALMSAPAMTTVSPDEREMGRLGIELLINRLEGKPGAHTQKLFEGTLQIRGTSGPAPTQIS